MKILFIGVLDIPWSTNLPMKREFENKGHKVIPFNYRTIVEGNVADSNSFLYRIKEGITHRLNKSWLPDFLQKLYYRVNGRYEMNKELKNEVKTEKYDLVFLAKADTIDWRIIPEINKYSKTWYYFMDPLSTASRMGAKIYAKLCNYASATHRDVNDLFNRNDANSIFLTQGVDTDLFAYRRSVKKYDVCFVGSVTKKRKEYIEYLKSKNINIIHYGPGTDNGPVYREELVELYNKSKIVLNLNRSDVGFSIRVFQVMGTGSFLLSEYCPDLEKIFNRKKHLDWFKSKNECIELIKYYLENDNKRKQIGLQGMRFVRKNYSWSQIIDKILKTINNN